MAALPERSASIRWFRSLAGVACGLATFWLTSACQTSCANNDQQPIRYIDGTTRTRGTQRIYESTPFDGEWLHFPGNRRFLLTHTLGTTPYSSLMMFIAFDSHPISGDAGDVAIATGDVAVVEKIDPYSLQIRNDTCSEQYLYVKATAEIDPDAPDAGL